MAGLGPASPGPLNPALQKIVGHTNGSWSNNSMMIGGGLAATSSGSP